jgi:hypothetical protein
MLPRHYYSVRTGKNPNSAINLEMLLRLFKDLYIKFNTKDYFQEAFGYICVDMGNVAGTLGTDIGAEIFRKVRKPSLWPIVDSCLNYSEDDLFDVVEFLYDHISAPTDGDYHSYQDCGWHYQTFDTDKGRKEFRNEVNQLLSDYSTGFGLSEDGEIFAFPDAGMASLLDASVPTYDPKNVEELVENAKRKFRLHRASVEDRKDAIKDLADVLEFLRPKLKNVIKDDESDLFQLANKFGIRHHNLEQKTDYDKTIWYSWMFYYYLATIHATIRLIQKHEKSAARSNS